MRPALGDAVVRRAVPAVGAGPPRRVRVAGAPDEFCVARAAVGAVVEAIVEGPVFIG